MLYSIKFRLRSQNHNPHTNLTPIYVRLTVNGVTASDFFSGVRCKPENWLQKAQTIIGSSEELHEDRKALENVRTTLKSIINSIDIPDAFTVRKMYLEKDVPPPTLVQAFEKYIKDEKESYKGTDKELSEKTIQKWYYSRDHLKSFVGENYQIHEVKKGFEKKYYKHLLSGGKMSNNHAIRNISYLNTVLDYCIDEGFCEENKLSLKSFSRDPSKPILYLSEEQVEAIEKLKFSDKQFQSCVDLFLFSTYTSLDNNELLKLGKDNFESDCIKITRGKTRNKSLQIIPILPRARKMLEKYDYQLPTQPTYRINRALDVLEKMLSLPFNLTTKIGRKTAGMFFLTNKVPIEVVSRILGHKSIVTTQKHYADIMNKILIINSTKHLM